MAEDNKEELNDTELEQVAGGAVKTPFEKECPNRFKSKAGTRAGKGLRDGSDEDIARVPPKVPLRRP